MTYVVIFITIATITGFLITCLLDVESIPSRHHLTIANCSRLSILERLTYGFVVGLVLSTWLVYILSLAFGLQFKCIYITMLMMTTFCLSFSIIRWRQLGRRILEDIRGLGSDFQLSRPLYFVNTAVFAIFAVLFWRLFSRIIIWHDGAMFTGLPNNYGDLPLHLSYITSFVWGDNIPPQNPSFAGETLAYPILSDFLSAIFLKLGAGFRAILFVPGFLLTTSFYGVLYYFVFRLTGRRIAAVVAAPLFFFSGGFGFFYFLQDIGNATDGLWHYVMHMPKDYTKITSLNYHWITPLTCLNVPQRALLFGFPMTIMVFAMLYLGAGRLGVERLGVARLRQVRGGGGQDSDRETWKLFLFAGIVAGLMPFFHTHSFMAMLMVTIPLGIIFWDWRKWFLFFMPAFIISLPQILYLHAHVEGSSFFKVHLGWMAGDESVLWFWLKNTGVFWPLYFSGVAIVVISMKRDAKNVHSLFLRFTIPFLILFILPNIVLLAPWKWDNIKVLIYWFVGSIPAVSIGLAYLYGDCSDTAAGHGIRFKVIRRVMFFITIFFLIFSGGLDVVRYSVAPIHGWKEYSKEAIEVSKQIIEKSDPDAVFLTAPIFNHVVFLSGRKTLMGYPGHIWSHGYKDYKRREKDIRRMLQGKSGADILLARYAPDYIVIGPHERRIGVNKRFYDINYKRILSSGNYSLYDLHAKLQDGKVLFLEDEQRLIEHGYGLSVDYFANAEWHGSAVYEEIRTDIAFDWPGEAEKPLRSPFSSLWAGYIDIPDAGEYKFRLGSDDGSWLYIDGRLIVDNGGSHAFKSVSGSVFLEEGGHEIAIKYFDGGGGAVMRLLWRPPGGGESEIPAKRLRYR